MTVYAASALRHCREIEADGLCGLRHCREIGEDGRPAQRSGLLISIHIASEVLLPDMASTLLIQQGLVMRLRHRLYGLVFQDLYVTGDGTSDEY